jgi:hypothetical protein
MPPVWNRQHRNLQGLLGQILSNYNGYGWTGTYAHSGLHLDYRVRRGTRGVPRADPQHRRLLQDACTLFGLSHKNPSMTPEEARKFMSRAPRIRTEDWA